MKDENKQQHGRSWFSYLLPYLLTGGIVVILIILVFSRVSQGTSNWKVGEIDNYVGYTLPTDNSTEGTINTEEGDFYISYFAATDRYGSVVYVQGRAYEKGKTNNNFTFQVTISSDQWNNAFEVQNQDSQEVVKHWSYSTIFQSKVAEWNANQDLVGRFGKGSFEEGDAYYVSFWDVWGPTIITVAGVILISVFILSRINSSVSGANRQAMDFNKSPARREDASKVRFADVAGCDEEKAEMVEMVDYLKEPKKYSRCGARLPKGVLLIGPPGTGKTLLAKAVAGEAGVPFYSISGSDFVEMFVGVGAGRVRDLFKKAKQTAPCIIFIDEIDAVGRQRGAGLGGGNDEREQTLNQLLVEMDGFEYNSGILVMAATNRDDVLDPALLRPGRFDRVVTVGLPDKNGREAIFKVHARNKKIALEVDFSALSQRTVGFSGADIENILNEAAILAVRFKKEFVGMEEIDEAIDRRIAGPAKSSKGLNEKERKQIAFHESGHAVIGLVLPNADKVQKITIIPRGNTGGHVLMTPESDRFLLTKKELIAEITGLLGGRTSEEIFFDDVSTGASNDIQEATRIARSMVTMYGMSDLGPIQYEQSNGSVFLGRDYANTTKNFSSAMALEIDKAVREIVDNAHAEAKRILTEHKADVILIAETLLAKETITAEEIDSLIKTGKLPSKEKAEVGANETLSDKEKAVIEAPKQEETATPIEAAPKKPRAPRKKKAPAPEEKEEK
ncbi:MAG: ATP-dependent zinc metalloprotease FtsH [Bacilli bacterium]|nr:ATP-dependent zinc metalloprotease FtsH [Bacilli bacterium]